MLQLSKDANLLLAHLSSTWPLAALESAPKHTKVATLGSIDPKTPVTEAWSQL